jgi:predicted negative regulator of RcsB-dependent stress response
MTDWFRNSDWTPEIEAAFEAQLSRSRTQKAQYLRIQGSILKDTHPQVAIRLLARCVDSGDEAHVAAALLETAHAHYRLGDIAGALAKLEAAMEQEALQPMFRTSAPFDFAMLVAVHGREERFDKALAVLDGTGDALMPMMEFQRAAARAIILSARGRAIDARAAARAALAAEAVEEGWIPGHPQVGIVPNRDNVLSARMREILSDRAG